MENNQLSGMKDNAPVLILAGGESSRMGMPKGLCQLGRLTLIEYQVHHLRISGLKNVNIVTGACHEEYEQKLPYMKFIYNENWAKGPFSSICKGLESIDYSNGCWILPVDTPCASITAWKKLLEAEGDIIKPTYQGKGGHPVYLSSEVCTKLLKVDLNSAQARLDQQIEEHGKVTAVEVDDIAVILNINSKEKLQEFKSTLLNIAVF